MTRPIGPTLRSAARAVLLASVALGLGACVTRPIPADIAVIDASFTPLTVRWVESGAGRTTVLARAERRDGRTVVCGALAQGGVPNAFANDTLHVLRTTELRHGTTRLLRDLHGFAGPRSPEAALCVISPVAWSDAFAGPGLRLGHVRDVVLDVRPRGFFGFRLRAVARVCPPGATDC